ncbi:MAG: choice-of-anchor J domain-containing protein [Muribaculaceae bacterium]|nr:choice-of-anchor J domain-containing protein [Muribaculaceae bacterium]
MKKLYFSISIALAMGVQGFAADQNVPPCTFAIDSQEAFDSWTSIDVNEDGGDNQWHYSASNQGALYVENRKQSADDWLISPQVELKAGTTYHVSAWVQSLSTFTSDKQQISLHYATSTDPAALTPNLLIKNESLTKTAYPIEFAGDFTPAENGGYYIGLHLYSKSYNGDCLVTKIEISAVLTHPGAVTNLTVEAGEKGAMEANLSWVWPELTDKGGTLDAITGARIYRATSSYSLSATDTYLVGTYEGDFTPGSEAHWTDNTLPAPGTYYYMVVPFNNNGASTSSSIKVQSGWIGPDTPGNVTNVVASADPEDDKKVYLSFDLPVGKNGGYVDLTDVGYRIRRTATATKETVTLEEKWMGELPYVDIVPGLDAYQYEVMTVAEGTSLFTGAKSNTITTGGTMALPYTNSFDNTDSIALWTLLNNGNGSRNWGISSSKLNYWGAGSAVDVYAVMPPFHLEAGKAYNISFTAYVNKDSKPLSIVMGEEPMADKLNVELFSEEISNTITASKEIKFSVKDDADYYIAFRINGNVAGSNDIYIDNLKIESIAAAPLPVENLTATALPDGELGATLKWKNPTISNTGLELTSISAIEIRRNNELIHTLTDLNVGEEVEYTDAEIKDAGYYTYTVTPLLGIEAGESAEVTTGWVGVDTPKAPSAVSVTLNENGSRSIAFDAVDESVHGGYVNYDKLTYYVSRNGEEIATDVKASPYIDVEEDLPLAPYTYGVTACFDNNSSTETFADAVVFGGALSLPYTPDFDNADFAQIWTFVNPKNPAKNWKYSAASGSKPASLQASFVDAGAWAITPPFKAIQGTAQVDYKATCYSARYSEDLEIYLIKDIDDLDNATKITDYHVSSVSYPSTVSTMFDIPITGVYYIGYKVVTDNQWTCSLLQSDIQQVYETSVDTITADTKRLTYSTDTQEIEVDAEGSITIHTAAGSEVMKIGSVSSSVSVKSLQSGIYIASFQSLTGEKAILKFVKK